MSNHTASFSACSPSAARCSALAAVSHSEHPHAGARRWAPARSSDAQSRSGTYRPAASRSITLSLPSSSNASIRVRNVVAAPFFTTRSRGMRSPEPRGNKQGSNTFRGGVVRGPDASHRWPMGSERRRELRPRPRTFAGRLWCRRAAHRRVRRFPRVFGGGSVVLVWSVMGLGRSVRGRQGAGEGAVAGVAGEGVVAARDYAGPAKPAAATNTAVVPTTQRNM
jgi:hypothetical protein